jgi:protein-ribulosamine 3-kinase
MVRGECKSQQELYAISPNLVPKPIGYGTYHSNPNTHFFLCELVEMIDELPEASDFCEKVADLHRRSTSISPSGMFGFDITTCNGKVPQENTWSSSWESFFIRSLQHEFILEEQVQGPSEEISALTPILYEKVCPRLLRPLETEGRTLSPALLHGCLRPGFIGVHATNNQPCIFAASSFWGHNEYDIAIWRVARYHMRRFIQEYFNYYPCSPPTEDWDDRNLLYSLRADLHDSIMYPGTRRFRDLIIVTLKQLTKKFGMGYQGNATRKDCGSENILDPPAVSPDVIDLEDL